MGVSHYFPLAPMYLIQFNSTFYIFAQKETTFIFFRKISAEDNMISTEPAKVQMFPKINDWTG